MKKFLSRIGIFIILMLVCNFIYLKTVQTFEWNFKKSKEITQLKDHKVDLLFIGSSLTFDAIDAKVLEREKINSFNLALAGANLKTTVLQLENYLNHNQNPNKIILGLSSCFVKNLDNEEILPVVDYYYTKPKLSYRELPMIKFKWLANEVLKIMTSKVHRDAHVYNGQFRSNKITPDHSAYPKEISTEFNTDRYENSSYLLKIDSICHSHKINLVSIEMPGFRKSQNEVGIGPHPYNNKLATHSEIYNFNNKEFAKIFNPETDWLTVSHLNVSGSAKFTEELLRIGLIK